MATTAAAAMGAATNPAAGRNNNHAGASKQAMTISKQSGGGGRSAARLLRAWAAVMVLAFAVALAACGNRGSQQQKSSAPPKSDFELGLDTVRRGSYIKIYVIRRTDGQPLTREDRDFLRENTPMETGMWIVPQDGRAAIAGAGFEFEPRHFEALSKRFTVEDYTNK
jgi:hypothetical protein